MTKITKKIIEDSINKSIIQVTKCPTSSRARKRGAISNVQETNNEKTITYSDGTSISFNKDGSVKNIQLDGVNYDYLGEKCYDYFQYQNDSLKNMTAKVSSFQNYNIRGGVMDRYDWDTEYDFASFMMDNFASSFGVALNREIFYGDGELRHYNPNKREFGSPVVAMDSDLHVNHFFDLARSNRIDNSNIVLTTLSRRLHQENNINKLQFTKKGYTSASAGGNQEDLEREFKWVDDGWTICTVVKKGSGAKGLFFGNALNDIRGRRFHDFKDWEAEVNLPPKTRFERDLIDETNHIIIQHIIKQ